MTSPSTLVCLIVENEETRLVEQAYQRCQTFLSVVCFT